MSFHFHYMEDSGNYTLQELIFVHYGRKQVIFFLGGGGEMFIYIFYENKKSRLYMFLNTLRYF